MKSRYFFVSGILITVFAVFVLEKSLVSSVYLSLKGKRTLISPLGSQINPPQILGEITTLENNIDYGNLLPEKAVLAKGAVAFDLTENKIIFEKNSHLRLQAASTMKIVTAAVALEKGQLGEKLTVNYFPTVVGESSMNLVFREKFSLEELLYGLLMVSGNDSAETIAQGLAGKREDFIIWLNDYCQKAGAAETKITTPSGLDEDGQYTTAWDLYLLGRYIFNKYPKVLEISVTQEKYLPKNADHRAYLLRNKLLLFNEFKILGAKPGLGEQGQMSLITLLEKNHHRILVSLIKTPSLRHDLTQILNQI